MTDSPRVSPAFARLVARMPSSGLIIDVHGNVGGYVALSQVLLQFVTHKDIEPGTFAFRATPITELCETCYDFVEKDYT